MFLESVYMTVIADILVFALNVYLWIVMASVLTSWMVAFDVLNTKNKWVYKGLVILHKATEPVMSRIRKHILTNFGGVDISPIIVFFMIWILQGLILGIAY